VRYSRVKIIGAGDQTVCLKESLATPMVSPTITPSEALLTRAQRAHGRLCWEQRLARNARPSDAPRLVVTLHGLLATFARSLDSNSSPPPKHSLQAFFLPSIMFDLVTFSVSRSIN